MFSYFELERGEKAALPKNREEVRADQPVCYFTCKIILLFIPAADGSDKKNKAQDSH